MTVHPRTTFGQDVFDDLKAMFEQAPAAPPDEKPTEYSKLELVRGLAPTIGALADRGWSWKALAAMMTQRGVIIAPDLLKAYFTRSQGKARRRPNNKTKSTAKNAPAPARVEAVSASAPNADLDDAAWDQTAPNPKASPAPPPTRIPPPAPRVVPTPARNADVAKPSAPSRSDVAPGPLVMRPDTPNL